MALITEAIKFPFKFAGRIGGAIEMAVPSLLHPEQLLSQSPRLKQLYNFTVKEQRMARVVGENFKLKTADIIKKYGLEDEEQVNSFLKLLEFPYYNKRPPNPAELAQYPRNIQSAVVEHLREVEDPIWQIAKKADPEIGYIAGHFTHFPVKALKNRKMDELKKVEKILGELPTDPSTISLREGYEAQKAQLARELQRASHVDDSLNALRYKVLPEGGRFGPLDEARHAQKLWNYKMNYKDVMDEYIDGAMRKVFLDRYMPIAKKLVESEPNAALRQYAFDYVTAQRGALAGARRIFLNESVARLFPNAETGYSSVAKGVDYATRFQYLAKIGLSWFRFPFVNATQPLLTTYPMVGGKNLLMGYRDALMHPQIWKEAKDVGVIFEASLRKGLVEALGRTPKLSKFERGISWPAKISEELNRVVSYAAGKRQAAEMGLSGEKMVDHAINLVNRTQFLYHKEAMPLIMSKSPTGRLIFQFRTFTANYVNFLAQLIRNKQWPQLGRAMGSLMVLAGSSAVPFNLWDATRKGLLRNAGVDIGDFNPIEAGTEVLGISPPVNFGASLEPFNIPSDVSQIFGPTAGPIIQALVRLQQKPEEIDTTLQQFFGGIAPPLTRLIRRVKGEGEVVSEPTKTQPRGRVLGERGIAETMFLGPSLEARRRRFIELAANAIAGGRNDLAEQFFQRAIKQGINITTEERRQAKARATKLKGFEPQVRALEVAPSTPPPIREITPFKYRR